jgi:hypothetical protein
VEKVLYATTTLRLDVHRQEGNEYNRIGETEDILESITMEEFSSVLQRTENKENPGIENLKLEMFKHGGHLLKVKVQEFFIKI